MGTALLVLQLATTCGEADTSRLQQASQASLRGDEKAAARILAAGVERGGNCVPLRVAELALRGWRVARALAPKGGAAEFLPPVQQILKQLRQLSPSEAALEVEYAETAIRAAVAAAQDERPEMELLLTHARDLTERLQLRGRRAVWPRSFNLLAGELWFEVDRYEDARLAYERAVRGEATPLAIVGLARAQARLGRAAAACATYRKAGDVAPALRAAAAADLARCR